MPRYSAATMMPAASASRGLLRSVASVISVGQMTSVGAVSA